MTTVFDIASVASVPSTCVANTSPANTSPLIALSSIKRLDLLRAAFPEVLIPHAVFDETVTNGQGWIEAEQLQRELALGDWLTRVEVPPSAVLQVLLNRLGGSGEAQAIVAAETRGLPVLLDELAGRRAAADRGVSVLGSLRILRMAKEAGRIDRIRPLVAQMIESGIYFHDDLVERFLREVGET